MTLILSRRGRATTGPTPLTLTYRGSDSETNVLTEQVGTTSFTASDYTVVVATWYNAEGTSEFINGLSVGAQALTKQAEEVGTFTGVSIWTYAGSTSGTITATTTDDLNEVAVFVYELTRGTVSIIDTDNGSGSLAALSSPGSGGHRICGAVSSSTISWTGATEEDEINVSSRYHSVAYDSGDDSGTISVTSASLAGVSFGAV